MADESGTPRPFDVRTIKFLVRMMKKNDLSEIDLAEGEQRIRLRRGAKVVGMPAVPMPVAPAAVPQTAPAPAAASPAAAPPAPTATLSGKKLIEIKCPTVGTFFTQRKPGDPPLVSVGSKVTPTTVLCIIEAMKVYSDIPAEVSGTVAEICVKNDTFVEYNTVLFRIDPAG